MKFDHKRVAAAILGLIFVAGTAADAIAYSTRTRVARSMAQPARNFTGRTVNVNRDRNRNTNLNRNVNYNRNINVNRNVNSNRNAKWNNTWRGGTAWHNGHWNNGIWHTGHWGAVVNPPQ